MTILLVEDTKSAIDTCIEYAENYTKNGKQISIVVAENTIEAIERLTKDIDVAIVDIKLNNNENGNDVIAKMQELCLRIPTVIHTGTPDDIQVENVLKVFTRGDGYPAIFDYLLQIYNTGITEILGYKGSFQQQIDNFYNSVFIKLKDAWMKKVENYSPEDVRKSLLRTLIYHIESLLDDDSGKTFSEEFYLNCSQNEIHTGSILKLKNEERYFILISPACDLVKRKNGNRNVDVLTLCEINNIEKHGLQLKSDNENGLGKDKQQSTTALFSNSKNRYHWIPELGDFKGGLLDFTKTISIEEKEYAKEYTLLEIRISPPYIKNILSRFSSYYARQGQPDLDVGSYINKLKLISNGDNQ